MSFIRPIPSGGNSPLAPTGSARAAKGTSASEITAQKVKAIPLPVLPKPVSLKGRQVTVGQEMRDLSRWISAHWNELTPEELAEKIIALEDKVSLLPAGPELEKIKRAVEELHFQFVFPAALDAKKFTQSVGKLAHQVLKTNSPQPFTQGLNRTQQREVERYTRGGQS